jgi:hypothetical protein
MERRDILKASAIFLGYGLVGGASIAVLNGCKADNSTDWSPSFFTEDEIAILAEASERIIPKTDTPGAKDALVHRFMDEALQNNYKAEDQLKFKEGVAVFDALSSDMFQSKFVAISDEQKDQILQHLVDASKNKKENEVIGDIFPHLKSLVVAGFFTSEVGATKALIYDPIPGPYQGCIPLSDVGGVYSL